MKISTWIVALLLIVSVVSFSGCSGGGAEKPLTPEDQKKIDDDMRKTIDQNKKS
jgi:hypothetical protein